MIIIESTSDLKKIGDDFAVANSLVFVKGVSSDVAMSQLYNALAEFTKKFMNDHDPECDATCPAMIFAKTIDRHCKQIMEEALTEVKGRKTL